MEEVEQVDEGVPGWSSREFENGGGHEERQK